MVFNMTLYIVTATTPEWDTNNKPYFQIWDSKRYAKADYELKKKDLIYGAVYLSVVKEAAQLIRKK